jgi:hypothetical protein
MAEAALQIAADLEQAQRLAAAQKAQLKSQLDAAHKELAKLNLEIREARKELEQTVKQNDHQRAVGRAMFESIA